MTHPEASTKMYGINMLSLFDKHIIQLHCVYQYTLTRSFLEELRKDLILLKRLYVDVSDG